MSGLSIIVAMDERRGIGKANRLPWHLPEDLGHFRALTTGHVVVMGRKTYESIGRPLPKRINVVLTRDPHWAPFAQMRDDFYVLPSIAEVSLFADSRPARRTFIIGGGHVYEQALPFVDELIVTHIPGNFECDTYFPYIDPTVWQVQSQRDLHSAALGIKLGVVTYRRHVS